MVLHFNEFYVFSLMNHFHLFQSRNVVWLLNFQFCIQTDKTTEVFFGFGFLFFQPFSTTAFFLDLSQSFSQAAGPKCVVSDNVSSEPWEPSLRQALSSCWLRGRQGEAFPTPKETEIEADWQFQIMGNSETNNSCKHHQFGKRHIDL